MAAKQTPTGEKNALYLLKLKVWNRDDWTCVYCGKYMGDLYKQWVAGELKRKKAQISVDHVIPVAKGGEWTEENLVTACIPCNSKKGDKIYEPTISV